MTPISPPDLSPLPPQDVSLDALEATIRAGRLDLALVIVDELRIVIPERERRLLINRNDMAMALDQMQQTVSSSQRHWSITDVAMEPAQPPVFSSKEEMVAAGRLMMMRGAMLDEREERLDRKEGLLRKRELDLARDEMDHLSAMIRVETRDVVAMGREEEEEEEDKEEEEEDKEEEDKNEIRLDKDDRGGCGGGGSNCRKRIKDGAQHQLLSALDGMQRIVERISHRLALAEQFSD